MDLPKHILVSTDFSEASEHALDAAAGFAKATGARITLLHVFDPTPMVPPAAIPAPRHMEEKVEQEMGERIQKELEQVRKDKLAEVQQVEPIAMRAHNPAAAICEEAAKRDADLVIVGTHGRTGVQHLLIGSVAERVVRHAPCPVLAVRGKRK